MSMDAATMGPASAQAAGGMDALIAAAKKEGNLTLIALPDDWSNYGEVKKSFSQKYGITVNTLNPDGSSQEELEAIKANKGNKGPQAPDAVEVGLAFGPSAKTDHLIQPYKVATWDSIPANLKDADGYYYGDYYGVMSMLVNKDVVKNVPQDWTDLLKPEYKSQVALAGDPRGSNQAIQSVYASGLGSGGSLDNAQAGLDFMAKLNQQGNLVPIIAKQASFAKGETPIELTWDYLALGARDALNGNPQVEVVLPKTGLYAGMYVQAVSAYAPHPNAAKLWMEYLYSDEGTLLWLKGYVRPVRFDDMMKRNVIPADVLKKLPAAEQYAKAVFPSPAQLDVAKKLITTNWDTVVKADIKKAP
ncbi:MAG: extracellular solute-binding protein [Herpetosiphonaceae bacterium]|nr:extracellular solute-binding protein [Herpetosiphonaceae bacterium]